MPTSLFTPVNMENPAREIDDIDRLVSHYWTPVLRFVFASVRDMDVAETVTQDCLWKAHRRRHLFRGDCSVHTWLLRIAINLIRDHARKQRWRFWNKAPRVSSDALHAWPDSRLSPEDAVLVQEQVAAVWDATRALSAKQRTAFLLRFVEECEISEIAQVMGLSENAVHVNLFRAVRAIRKRMGITP